MITLIPRTSDPDVLAKKLYNVAILAKQMPPSWEGARVSIPFCGLGGEYVGRLLPGRGLYLGMDLKEVGIRKQIPLIYERTPVQKFLEAFGDDRAAIRATAMLAAAVLFPETVPLVHLGVLTTLQGILSARAAGQKDDQVIAASVWSILAFSWKCGFQRNTGFPIQGSYTAIPGGSALDKTSAGSWSVGLKNPTSPNKKYLLSFGFDDTGANLNGGLLVDLLVGAGGINANLATSQIVNTVALNRYTDGSGVMLYFDVQTTLGGSSANLTVTSYTNQAGTAGRSSPAVALRTGAGQTRSVQSEATGFGPLWPLQAGDFGIRSVETVQLSAAMGGGTFACVLYFPLIYFAGLLTGAGYENDYLRTPTALIELATTPGGNLGCLNILVDSGLNNETFTSNFMLRTVEG